MPAISSEVIHAFAAHIWQATGVKLENPVAQVVGGGSINRAFLLSDGNSKFFVKTNSASGITMFAAEKIALEQIRATQTIQVPKPICVGIGADLAFLILEWKDLKHSPNWQQLGFQLAALHKVKSSCGFGWSQSNTIGSTPQINTWNSSWQNFWWEQRLQFQLRLAKENGFDAHNQAPNYLDFEPEIPKFFENYNPEPSLVHGDLWSGNVGFDASGAPIIFDPALYFGDREVDLAMTELFGGFPAEFYQSYNQAFPIDAGYKHRKTLYNLYHILNHFNLFGGSYGSRAAAMIAEIKLTKL